MPNNVNSYKRCIVLLGLNSKGKNDQRFEKLHAIMNMTVSNTCHEMKLVNGKCSERMHVHGFWLRMLAELSPHCPFFVKVATTNTSVRCHSYDFK